MSRRFSTTSRCGLSRLQQFRGSQQPFSSKPWKLGSAHLELLSLQCLGSIAIGDMHLLLFEGAAHLSSQFIEKLPDGAIIKIAGVLRENLTMMPAPPNPWRICDAISAVSEWDRAQASEPSVNTARPQPNTRRSAHHSPADLRPRCSRAPAISVFA